MTNEDRDLVGWQGVVRDVDANSRLMRVTLTDVSGRFPPHSADIGLDQVPVPDRCRIVPGAVFNLVPGDDGQRMEFRLRKGVTWSAAQIGEVGRQARMLHGKLRSKDPVRG